MGQSEAHRCMFMQICCYSVLFLVSGDQSVLVM